MTKTKSIQIRIAKTKRKGGWRAAGDSFVSLALFLGISRDVFFDVFVYSAAPGALSFRGGGHPDRTGDGRCRVPPHRTSGDFCTLAGGVCSRGFLPASGRGGAWHQSDLGWDRGGIFSYLSAHHITGYRRHRSDADVCAGTGRDAARRGECLSYAKLQRTACAVAVLCTEAFAGRLRSGIGCLLGAADGLWYRGTALPLLF